MTLEELRKGRLMAESVRAFRHDQYLRVVNGEPLEYAGCEEQYDTSTEFQVLTNEVEAGCPHEDLFDFEHVQFYWRLFIKKSRERKEAMADEGRWFEWVDAHRISAYVSLILLTFRLIWPFKGMIPLRNVEIVLHYLAS